MPEQEFLILLEIAEIIDLLTPSLSLIGAGIFLSGLP